MKDIRDMEGKIIDTRMNDLRIYEGRCPTLRAQRDGARFAATRRRQLRFRLPASQQNRPILRKPTRTPAQKARKPVTTAI